MSWIHDKKRFDPFMKQVFRIVAPHVVVETSITDDRAGVDLKTSALEIAVRCRKIEYLRRYPFDVTIRYSRPSMALTDWVKWVEQGKNDLFVYTFIDESRGIIRAFRVLSLSHFRDQWIHRPTTIHRELQENRDGSSTFMAVDTRSLEPKVTLRKWISSEFRQGQSK